MKRVNEQVVRRLVRRVLSQHNIDFLTVDSDLENKLGVDKYATCIEELEVELSTIFSSPKECVNVDLQGCNTWNKILLQCTRYYEDDRVFIIRKCYEGNDDLFRQNMLNDLFDLVDSISEDGSPTAQYIEDDLRDLLSKYIEDVL